MKHGFKIPRLKFEGFPPRNAQLLVAAARLGYDKSKQDIFGALGQQWRKAMSRRRCAVPRRYGEANGGPNGV